jgi:hypothetical protein
MPRRRGLAPRLLAAVIRSNATLASAAERQVVMRSDGISMVPPLVSRIAVAAMSGLLVQLGILVAIEGGDLVAVTTSLSILAPSLLSTAAVAWVLRRRFDTFPGRGYWPLFLALFSSYVSAAVSGLLLDAVALPGHRFATWILLTSVIGSMAIGMSVFLLVRRFELMPALAMFGASAAIGGVAFTTRDEVVIVLGTTIAWTGAIGSLAGVWMARTLTLRSEPHNPALNPTGLRPAG